MPPGRILVMEGAPSPAAVGLIDATAKTGAADCAAITAVPNAPRKVSRTPTRDEDRRRDRWQARGSCSMTSLRRRVISPVGQTTKVGTYRIRSEMARPPPDLRLSGYGEQPLDGRHQVFRQ